MPRCSNLDLGTVLGRPGVTGQPAEGQHGDQGLPLLYGVSGCKSNWALVVSDHEALCQFFADELTALAKATQVLHAETGRARTQTD